MSQAARGEFYSGGEAKFWVTRKFGVGFAIVKQMFRGHGALKYGEDILGRNTVTWTALQG